jgi:hypothetical protein
MINKVKIQINSLAIFCLFFSFECLSKDPSDGLYGHRQRITAQETIQKLCNEPGIIAISQSVDIDNNKKYIKTSEYPFGILSDNSSYYKAIECYKRIPPGSVIEYIDKYEYYSLDNPLSKGPSWAGLWYKVITNDGAIGWVLGNSAWDKKEYAVEIDINTISLSHDELPQFPYEDAGACPFECCAYRNWIANKDIEIQQDRNENSPTLFNIKKGEWVKALTGVVITTVPGQAKLIKPTTINGMSAKIGEIVYLMTYHGEGEYETWYKGKKWEPYADVDALEIIEKPVSIWWAQIKNNKGQIGWTKDTDSFDNQDECGGVVLEQPIKPTINDSVNTTSQPSLKLSATTLGRTHRDYNLVIKTPPRIWVNIVFQALLEIPSSSPTYPLININNVGYIWTVDGELQATQQSSLSWKFEKNQDSKIHVISVKAINRDAGTPILFEPATMQISITEEEAWNCKGRLGEGCYDSVIANNTLTTNSDVLTSGCPQGHICIVSKISAGAILHDKCCKTKPNGYYCHGPESDQAEYTDCGPQFDQAIVDKATGKMFDHTWIYPPDGTDPVSAGNDGWWKQLIGAGVTISSRKEMPSSEDQSICESGRAELKKQSTVVTFATGAYPYPSRSYEDYVWACSEIETPSSNISKANLTNIQQPTTSSSNPDCRQPTLSTPISSSLTGSASETLNKYNVLDNAGCR